MLKDVIVVIAVVYLLPGLIVAGVALGAEVFFHSALAGALAFALGAALVAYTISSFRNQIIRRIELYWMPGIAREVYRKTGKFN